MFNSLHGHSMYSLLDGLSPIEKLVSRYKELGYTAAALTDHRTISGCIKFFKECNKQGIKPILGCEFDVTEGKASFKSKENPTGHLVVLAKNLSGWKGLIKCVSESNNEENFYFRPRVDLDILSEFKDDFVVISGHPGSTLGDVFIDKAVYRCKTKEEVYDYLKLDIDIFLAETINKYSDIFGDNFFLEIQQFDNNPVQDVLAEIMRDYSKRCDIRKVATLDVHYANKEDAVDQRLILCSSINKTFPEAKKLMSKGEFGLEGFFKTDAYYIHAPEDVEKMHTQDEIENTQIIADMCEEYNILKSPILPKYSDDEMGDLRELCDKGWKEKVESLIEEEQKKVYQDRLDEEFEVIEEAGLAGYFLIVQDYCNWYKQQGGLLGPGRGCLFNTNVFTKDGIKDISKVKVGDKVICESGNYNTVTNIHEYYCDEPCLNIKTWYGDYKGISLTSDHEILVESGKRPDRWEELSENTKSSIKQWKEPVGKVEWKRADSLKVGDWIYYPIPKSFNRDIFIDCSFMQQKRKNGSHTYIDGDTINHRKAGTKYNKAKILSIPKYFLINDEFAYILGVFAGDGWISKGRNSVSFCFHSIDNVESQERVVKYFNKYNCDISIYENHDGKLVNEVHINNFLFCELFKYIFDEYKHTPQTKHVPKCIFSSPSFIKDKFLEGLIDSDGHREKFSIKIDSVSKKMIFQVKELLLYKSILGHVGKSIRFDEREDFPDESTSYSIRWNSHNQLYLRKFGNYVLTQIREISDVYTDKVYDISVENESNYCTSNGLVHNSAAGCLVSYLVGITEIDPIKYGLIFSRFYNIARKGSLPDIDCDFEKGKREEVIEYLKNKYGQNNVSHMATFGRLMGRGALKEVLRINNVVSPAEINKITKNIPDEAKIADELADMDEKSIILWSLINEPEKLSQWCTYKNGKFSGDYAQYFEQAVRIEGTFKSQGKHAAGIIISDEDLNEVCPMARDKSGDKTAALEMSDLEDIGQVKMDLLGVQSLNRLSETNLLIGENYEEDLHKESVV